MSMLQGSFTALITPFTDDGGAVDFARLDEQIRFQATGGVTGVVPRGTTGESPTLTDGEHRRVVEQTIESAKPMGLTVIAGAGSNNTAHAIELHRFAQHVGADASLQVNPYYNKPSQEGLYRHFSSIADSADLPIVLYNIPGRSCVALTPETVERLAAHPNIVAIKEATGSLDSASSILERTHLTLLSGDDSMTLPFASVGGKGVISVIGNLVPERTAALCNAIIAEDWILARTIHFDLFPLAQGMLSLDTNPIPLKAAMSLLGRDSGAMRLPMCEPGDEIIAKIATLLETCEIYPHEEVAAE